MHIEACENRDVQESSQASEGNKPHVLRKVPRFTAHSNWRLAQCNMQRRDIGLVLKYGVLERRTGVRFYFIRKKDVERYRKVEPRLVKLHDAVVIVSSDDSWVVTMYRNKKALRTIRRKLKGYRKFGRDAA